MGYFTENLRELERMRQRSQANIDKATGALDKQNKAIDKFAADSKKNSEEYKAMMKKKMAESGIFGAVELESCFVLEGEQADAYKAKKIKAMNRTGDSDIRRHPERKVMEALDMLASIDYPYNG